MWRSKPLPANLVRNALVPFAKQYSIKIGDVVLKQNEPKHIEKVPIIFQQKLDQETLQHLRWMAQKDALKQDIFLIGHPGSYKRQLAFLYCALTKQEIEYVAITKDTSEHDLKQRREITEGNAFYVDQAVVQAALHGRILILDGKKLLPQ